MRKIYFLYCFLFVVFIVKSQQDAHFNLYQFNPIIINPACVGSKDGVSAVIARRQQWIGFDGAPVTNCLSLHGPILNKNIGIGLTIINDVIGPKTLLGVYANMAYILRLNDKTKLSFGMNAGYNRYQFNYSKIAFMPNTPEAIVNSQNLQTINSLDINGGLYLKTNSFFIGLSATHLSMPTLNLNTDANSTNLAYQLSSHLFLTAGKSFKLNENIIFAPTVMVKKIYDQYGSDLNLNFLIFKKIWLGAFYRYGYGCGTLFQYHVNGSLKVAYSYETGLGNQINFGSSHEVVIGFDFKNKTNKSKTIHPRFL